MALARTIRPTAAAGASGVKLSHSPNNPWANLLAWKNVRDAGFAKQGLTPAQGMAQYNAAHGIGGPSAAAASAAGGAGGAPSTPAAPNPRDSTFNLGVNQLLRNTQSQRDALRAQGDAANQDFNTMLSRMADQRAKDLLTTNEQANREGLFYSGQLGQRRDNVEQGYQQRQQDAQTAYDRANAARSAALDQLGNISADASSPLGYSGSGQASLDLAGLYNDAIQRAAAANANGGADAAAQTQLAATPQAQPAAAPAAPGGDIVIRPSASHGGARWVYHRGASGKLIPIRPA